MYVLLVGEEERLVIGVFCDLLVVFLEFCDCVV